MGPQLDVGQGRIEFVFGRKNSDGGVMGISIEGKRVNPVRQGSMVERNCFMRAPLLYIIRT